METQKTAARIIHSYDPERRRVLCGVTEQTNSTKHAASVTCPTCLQLLHARMAVQPEDAAAAHGA